MQVRAIHKNLNIFQKIKIMQMKLYLLLVTALITISVGCKKDKNEEPACRINRLIDRFGKEIKVTYNADGKYAKIENTHYDGTVTTSYSSNSIVITRVTTSTGTRKSKSTLLLNSSGMVYALRDEYYNTSGTNVKSSVENEFEYSGSQLIKSITVDSFNSQQSISTKTTNYTWSGGNLISAVTGTFMEKYEYYADKPFQQGDMQSVYRLFRGYDINLIIKNKNLTKSVNSGQYTYDFDAEGKINGLKYNGSNDHLVEYECN